MLCGIYHSKLGGRGMECELVGSIGGDSGTGSVVDSMSSEDMEQVMQLLESGKELTEEDKYQVYRFMRLLADFDATAIDAMTKAGYTVDDIVYFMGASDTEDAARHVAFYNSVPNAMVKFQQSGRMVRVLSQYLYIGSLIAALWARDLGSALILVTLASFVGSCADLQALMYKGLKESEEANRELMVWGNLLVIVILAFFSNYFGTIGRFNLSDWFQRGTVVYYGAVMVYDKLRERVGSSQK